MITWPVESLRFIIVGITSNVILYLLYIGLNRIGLGYKSSVTLLYFIGILQTFIFNKHWTFSYRGNIKNSLLRYLLIYGFFYFINLISLYFFVDRLGYSPIWIQGFAIPIIAVLLFFTQKYWVFASRPPRISDGIS